jgi:hypothetical protein
VQFTPRERCLAFHALADAEARTSGYYCIPPFRWQKLHYDLLTRKDREWRPLPEGMLARTQRCELRTTRRPELSDFFRIELNDPGILTAAHRERLRNDIYPLLLYILTHEMVHLVRLSSILTDAEQLTLPRESEESRVSQIARSILMTATAPGLDAVLERF